MCAKKQRYKILLPYTTEKSHRRYKQEIISSAEFQRNDTSWGKM